MTPLVGVAAWTKLRPAPGARRQIVAALFVSVALSACAEDNADQRMPAEDPLLPLAQGPYPSPGQAGVIADMAIAAAISDPDRPTEDKARDDQRKPQIVLQLAGVTRGMTVLDLFAAGGWYTELLARLVGPVGRVYAQNPPSYLERFGDDEIARRLAGDRLPNVVRHDRPMDALDLPTETFDAIMAALIFHDLFWLSDDVAGVIDQLYASLKPGGVLIVTDHSAPAGTGTAMAESIDGKHRIDEAVAHRMMAEAGFELIAESDALRVPEDDRTLAFFEPGMQGRHTDRFVLVFRKPENP